MINNRRYDSANSKSTGCLFSLSENNIDSLAGVDEVRVVDIVLFNQITIPPGVINIMFGNIP